MSDFQTIEEKLQNTAHRFRWHRGWRGAWQGLLWGGVLWLAALITYKLAPIPWDILAWCGIAWMLAIVAGFFIGWSRPVTVAEIARWVDQKQQLKERLSTALEVSRNAKAGEWKDLVVADAAGHVKNVDPRQLLPLHLPSLSRWALLVVVLAAGLGFVPEYRTKEFVQKQKEA
ncbi:MAG: hypothetical protein AB1705_06180, partial [Verrucomicrobiota bacterium]